MSKNNVRPSHKGQGKDKHFQAELERVFWAFYSAPKTMKEVDIEFSTQISQVL